MASHVESVHLQPWHTNDCRDWRLHIMSYARRSAIRRQPHHARSISRIRDESPLDNVDDHNSFYRLL